MKEGIITTIILTILILLNIILHIIRIYHIEPIRDKAISVVFSVAQVVFLILTIVYIIKVWQIIIIL